MNSSSTRFWILFVALVLSGAIINAWERAGEAKVSRKPLREFASQLGSWQQQGDDDQFDDETQRVLRADDYVSRNFNSNGRYASLYIGYYATQKNGASYHSPLNCLPGAGWVMTDGQQITISAAGQASFNANRYVIQNGNQRAVMIYWYQGRGRSIASEYWAKIYTVIDSVARRRSDGALVRVMSPIDKSPEDAERAAIDLASQAANELPAYVPN
ncbi:MAG TPA: EpsI family protein [Pyrinomonadaceae bacterium]|jgi:EpsI family protein|nr:EpsI family protein [Pyrinomonadaceae bacterium]